MGKKGIAKKRKMTTQRRTSKVRAKVAEPKDAALVPMYRMKAKDDRILIMVMMTATTTYLKK